MTDSNQQSIQTHTIRIKISNMIGTLEVGQTVVFPGGTEFKLIKIEDDALVLESLTQ